MTVRIGGPEWDQCWANVQQAMREHDRKAGLPCATHPDQAHVWVKTRSFVEGHHYYRCACGAARPPKLEKE